MKSGFAIAIALLTLIVGIIGITTDTRNETTKKLTKWGWALVVFTVILGTTTMGSAIIDYQEEQKQQQTVNEKYRETIRFQDSIQRKTEILLHNLDSSVAKLQNINGNLNKSTAEIQTVHHKSDSILNDLDLSLAHQENLLNKTDMLYLNSIRAKYPLYPMEIVLVFDINFEDLDVEHYDFIRDFKLYFDTVTVSNKDTAKYAITKKEGIIISADSRRLKHVNQIDTLTFKGRKDYYVRTNFSPIVAVYLCNNFIEQTSKLISEENSKTHIIPMTYGDSHEDISFSYRILPTTKKLQIIIRQKNIHNIISLSGTGSSIHDYYQNGVIVIRGLKFKNYSPKYYNLRSMQIMCGQNREVSLDYNASVIIPIIIENEKAFLIKFNTNEAREFSKSNYPFY